MSGSFGKLADSTSSNQTFSFGAESVSDVTLYYQKASFHMHQYVLMTNSKYFDALLSAGPDVLTANQNQSCLLSDRCRSSNLSPHRCVTLESDEIGGVKVTVEQLHEFFRCVYTETSEEWRDRVKTERQAMTGFPSHLYVFCVVSVDATADEVVGDSYEVDRVCRHVVKGGTLTGGVKASAVQKPGEWTSRSDMSEHPNYHLADYFQCTSLLSRYEKQALVNAQAVSKGSTLLLQEQLWRLLLLSDRYGWPEVRKLCIEACSKHTECAKCDIWPMILKNMKPATLAELFVTAASRKI